MSSLRDLQEAAGGVALGRRCLLCPGQRAPHGVGIPGGSSSSGKGLWLQLWGCYGVETLRRIQQGKVGRGSLLVAPKEGWNPGQQIQWLRVL